MPDEQGNFLPGGFAIRGSGGELKHGHRVVSDLLSWTAKTLAANENSVRLRIDVKSMDADPYWIEHAPDKGLSLSIAIGRRELIGTANIVSRYPTLVLEAELEAV